ncbi:hypothetical protein PAAG_00955 [Paracoccidioides lutzii Pb01]|uniref:HNH nuclease domain-containing protein n=1 Tax=Paracoccidioides lutzii (strain ATCC MYA-826 / Pb01) TaxID=502779 RepID=C1GR10_PARBA|nr:hypothetical protein PAAG_00955 [Paracoccidioides lutzii Pb01]EEH38034.2 hypothetical protein PAAG_00955 [Paracoccidioides lutzii Pb01]
MAQRHPHQASFEGIINVSASGPLIATQRARARRIFYSIVDYFGPPPSDQRPSEYNRPLLVRYTYEFSRSELSQDTFLRAFFEFMKWDIAEEDEAKFNINLENETMKNELHTNLTLFADFLFDNFFLPLKASGFHNAQPTPAHLSVIEKALGGPQEFIATTDRLSVLRGSCLIRDHNRCVISRVFDGKEALTRLRRDGVDAQDDEGDPLHGQSTMILEVAHIIPHSLTQANANAELDDSKKAALLILNMFDYDVSHVIDGVNIDGPFNAISLTRDLHTYFGNFEVFFQAVPGRDHTYLIDTFLPQGFLHYLPVNRSLYLAADRLIDAPSPRLLAIHCAIAHILHLSAAGEYIDHILGDMEEFGVREDGSTGLGYLVKLRFGGWLDRGDRKRTGNWCT